MERKFTILLRFTLYSRANSKYKPSGGGGAYIRRGDLTEGFLRYDFRGLYLEGLIFGILRYIVVLCLRSGILSDFVGF